jgi:hypothetical protein
MYVHRRLGFFEKFFKAMLEDESSVDAMPVEKNVTQKHVCVPGLPDFSWYKIPKRGKIYQMTTKYSKWP